MSEPPVAALLADSLEALRKGDRGKALALIAQAQARAPKDPAPWLQRALVHRTAGEFAQALNALDHALAADPYNFLALLSKGAVTERVSGVRAAARIYEDALKLAPADGNLAPNLSGPTTRARETVAQVRAELEAHLRAALAGLPRPGPKAAARIDEAIAIYAGTRTPPPQPEPAQAPLLLHYPHLAALPFWPRDRFPWLAELEAATEVIRGELEAVLADDAGRFAPYIAYPPEAPVNQWAELNHSRRWSTYFLWRDGERMDEACARCPRTAALLDRLPMARQPDLAPTAMFSALSARTTIPPHTGSSNTRLIVHLPLVLPGAAGFRVGPETRDWRMGEAWVFDDTIEHEAWNDADAMRTILIFDVWHPDLEPAERDLITAMMAARNAFYGA